ncbi:hypothetical protein [Paenibacillus phytohabitans]|uniref:hypothetical protein n=1 Tax=Paenibacillus phytohabitans TaxID=2654978 RepID=UPI003007FAF5
MVVSYLDDFIAKVHMWCSGDTSESKTIDERKALYAEISKETANITDYEINEMNKINADEYEVVVDRSWDNGSDNTAVYSMIKMMGYGRWMTCSDETGL